MMALFAMPRILLEFRRGEVAKVTLAYHFSRLNRLVRFTGVMATWLTPDVIPLLPFQELAKQCIPRWRVIAARRPPFGHEALKSHFFRLGRLR
jgi:hypothetical protein